MELEIEIGKETTVKDGHSLDIPIMKKFHFREDFSCLDYVMIGLPLIDLQKYTVKDPISGEKIFTLDPTKMEEQDMRALNKWNLNFINQMNADNINWEKSQDIYAMNMILAHPKMQDLIQRCIKRINPEASRISEKKSLMK